jgi:hypothetical protein
MQSSGVHLTLIFLLWTATLLLTSAASQPHHQQALKDVKKLQAGFWLKVAAKHARTNDADAACQKDYGQPYLDRWRKLQGSYCNSSSSNTNSHVQCYAHPEADLSTCFARDLVLTSTPGFTGSTPHSSELPQPQPGSIHLSCNRTADPARFLRGRLQSNEGSRAWLVTAPAFGPASTQLQAACSGPQAVAHPVLFVLRVDPQNAFHNLETVVSVFSALAVLQLDPHHLTHGLEVSVRWLALPTSVGHLKAWLRARMHMHVSCIHLVASQGGRNVATTDTPCIAGCTCPHATNALKSTKDSTSCPQSEHMCVSHSLLALLTGGHRGR